MIYLAAVSCLWAFSFGLIGSRLSGLDSNFVAAARLGIALACFAPFVRLGRTTWRERLELAGIGALQFGVMYVAYIRAFAYLPSHLVALFSVLTPLYIALACSVWEKRLGWKLVGCALLSIGGAAAIRFSQPEGSFWLGFGLMQVSNVAFGLGQLLYRGWRRRRPDGADREIFGWLYLGGAALAGMVLVVAGDGERMRPSGEQWLVIAYLGVVASGLGFFLWNKGAAATAPGALAAFNNAVVPLGMGVSLFYFGEAAAVPLESLAKLAVGGALIGAGIWWGRGASRR